MSNISCYLTLPQPEDAPSPQTIPDGDVKGPTFAQHFADGGGVPISLNFGKHAKLFLLSRCLRLGSDKYVACSKQNLLKHKFSTKPSKLVAMLTDIQFVKALGVRDLVGMGLLILALDHHARTHGFEFPLHTTSHKLGVATVESSLGLFLPLDYGEASQMLAQAVAAYQPSDEVYSLLLDGCEQTVRAAAFQASSRFRTTTPQQLAHNAYTELLMLVARCKTPIHAKEAVNE